MPRGVPRPCLLQKIAKGTVEIAGQRSQPQGRGRNRPCLLQKIAKGTVEIAGQRSQPTVPFAKNRQRHGRNGGAECATDRAFYKKTTKARSKSRSSGRNRPCLLQKNDKGTVEIAAQTVQSTVPFAKNNQRHGRNRGVAGVADRAFCKKSLKARSKSWGRRCN